MTTDPGGSLPHAQTIACAEGDSPETLKAPDWRSLPRYERVHDTITEGNAVGVLLSNRPLRVWIDQADYQRVSTTYGAVRWRWHEKLGSVVLRDRPHHYAAVARLVIGEDAEGFVQYSDEDRLNLRRSNLSVDATKRPRRDGTTKVRAEKAAEIERGRAERRALRAERAKATGDAPRMNQLRKRAPSSPVVRLAPPPPPLSARPQIPQQQRSAPQRSITVVEGVKRTTLSP